MNVLRTWVNLLIFVLTFLFTLPYFVFTELIQGLKAAWYKEQIRQLEAQLALHLDQEFNQLAEASKKGVLVAYPVDSDNCEVDKYDDCEHQACPHWGYCTFWR